MHQICEVRCLKAFSLMQDSLAFQMPPVVFGQIGGAQQIVLEFWNGTAPVGTCTMPIQSILEAAAEHVSI